MNSQTIEILAVNAVEEYIMKSPYMAPHISENDKTPIWDGNIYLYSRQAKRENKIQSVENFKGRIPVQVKGKYVRALPKRPSFQISKSSLNAYKKDGGVIFYVVYLLEDQKFIYNAFLTSLDIKRYISKANGKSSVSVHMEPSQPMDHSIEDSYFEFWDNCKRQSSFTESGILTLEDAIKSGNPINIISRKKNKEEVLHDILSSPKYLYSEIEYHNTKILYPIGDQKYHITPVKNKMAPVIAGGKVFFDSYQISHLDNSTILNVGKCVEIIFCENGGESKFNYKKSAVLLNDLVKEFDFILTIIKHKFLEIDGNRIDINVKRIGVISKLEKEYRYWTKVKEVMDLLHCEIDLDTTKFRREDFSNIDLLYDCLIKKQLFEHKGELDPVVTVDILQYSVMLWANKQSDGKYILSDFFDLSNSKEITYEFNGKRYKTSIFTVLFNRFDCTKILNADYSILVGSYEQLYDVNPQIVDRCNSDMLMLLKQYDEDSVKKPHILNAAERMIVWVSQKSTDDAIVNTINKYQIIRRKRQLNEAEKDELCTLLIAKDTSDESKAAINILLDNKLLSQKYIDALSEEEKVIFKSYPIYNLL